LLLRRRKRKKILEGIYENLGYSIGAIRECVADVKEINERFKKLV